MKNMNESGRSMVEMLGVLAIIGVLSVGGIAGYSKAMSKYKVNKTIDQVTMLVANIRTTYASQNNYEGFDTDKAIDYGIISNDMYKTTTTGSGEAAVTANDVTNPYAGKVTISPSPATSGNADSAFIITYHAIPKDACRTILTSDWGSDLGSGLIAVGAIEETSSTATGPDLSQAYVGGEAGTGYKTPKDGLPYKLSDAIDACKETNIISWKYY